MGLGGIWAEGATVTVQFLYRRHTTTLYQLKALQNEIYVTLPGYAYSSHDTSTTYRVLPLAMHGQVLSRLLKRVPYSSAIPNSSWPPGPSTSADVPNMFSV